MPVIRTPDEHFDNLPDFPYEPNYIEVSGLRMHYLDQGDGEAILCLHGEPSWSYLYRKMIPPLAVRHRVIAPDFIGFGRSDKFTELDEYTFEMHAAMLVGFIEALNLNDITLVVQDWGGLLGLWAASLHPDRFARLVIMNTGLPTGVSPPSRAFLAFQHFVRDNPDFSIGRVIRAGMLHGDKISAEVISAYDAPFPDASYKAGAAAFPLLVPTSTDHPVFAEMKRAQKGLVKWDKPALVMFSDGDPITAGADAFFRKLIPTATDQPEIVIEDAGHFLQEEKGEEIAQHILEFITRTSAA